MFLVLVATLLQCASGRTPKSPFPSDFNNTEISLALDPSGESQHCTFEYPRVAFLRDTLYLDGGETRMMNGFNASTSYYDINNRLLLLNLSRPFDYSNYSIDSRSKPETIPNLAVGAAWAPSFASENKFYAFGGNYPSNNESARNYVAPPEHIDEVGQIWSYNVASEIWSTEHPGASLTGVAGGTAAMNPLTNEAYYLGGVQDSWVLRDAPSLFIDGMLVLNMTDASWRNESVPGPATTAAFMEWLPVGEKGVLVLFGGQDFEEGVLDPEGDRPNSMSRIRIYDIASREWHSQNATGETNHPNDLPQPRVLGCSSLVSAPDNSSFNIYVFGGDDELLGNRLSDMWILSLPSFTWMHVYDDAIGAVGARCMPFGRQMMLVGSQELDAETCQEFFRIFDMTSLEWTNVFDPNAKAYEVPKVVSEAIGGNEKGEAKIIEPIKDSGSWNSTLQGIFARTPWGMNKAFNYTIHTNATTNATTSAAVPSSSSTPSASATPKTTSGSGLSRNVIIGVSVGASVAVVLAAIALYLFIRSRHTSSKTPLAPEAESRDEASRPYLDGTIVVPEIHEASTHLDGIIVVPGLHEAHPPDLPESDVRDPHLGHQADTGNTEVFEAHPRSPDVAEAGVILSTDKIEVQRYA